MASGTLLAAQTTAKPATTAKTTAHPAATHATATHAATPALPAGITPVKAPFKTAFALRYQDVTVGTGPLAEPNKVYKVAYTGWLASDGRKFDASADHPPSPILDKNLQVVKDEDGKPKTEAGQPIVFPQGFGRVIPGWDQGFEGMHVGGKRRIFIPWQLAYGAKGKPSGDPKNPGIPAKADLIFDVELVDMLEMPAPPQHPAGHPGALPAGHPPVSSAPAPAAPATAAPAAAAPAAPAAKVPEAKAPAATATPATPPAQSK